ncbi:MAG: hypothetical protein J6V95_02130, partial [Bacteroidaceae bacterium]|nr:hypothetical protein [Bacteroidaceae bacterium]
MKVLRMTDICKLLCALAAVLCVTASCIEPPLHLPGQELQMMMPKVDTELSVVWDFDVSLDEEWYYGWDNTDDSIWGNIGYTIPSGYEVHRYFKGDDPYSWHTSVDAFSIRTNKFRRYFQFGYYDMLFYSDIDSKDGTQVVVMHETLDSVTATTTGTRGLSRSILDATRSGGENTPGAIGLLNQPEIFYGA